MSNLYDVLEICLQELEKGAELDSLLARYPEHASEIQPILQTSILARSATPTDPSIDAIRRSRAKLMQRATELREEKGIPVRKPNKRAISLFQRLAITFSLTGVLLASGTGLVSASSNALPGEKLYPVKRSWEDVQLFFTFDKIQRGLLESEFESERLNEVSDLITAGRHETTQFAGVFMEVKGKTYVSGIQVLITTNTKLPSGTIQDGAAVIVTGHTNADGYVELDSMDVLPAGKVVPLGNPVEVEMPESSNDGTPNNSSGSVSTSGEETHENQSGQRPTLEGQSFQMEGTVNSISNSAVIVNNQTIYFDKNTIIEGSIASGSQVEVEGFYSADGRFIVTKIKVSESRSGSENNSSGSNSGSNKPGSGNSGSGGDGSGKGDTGSGDSGGGDDHGGGN